MVNDALGCWKVHVGAVHWVHSGASIANLDPTNFSSVARGLVLLRCDDPLLGGATAVRYSVYVSGWVKWS